VLGVGDSIPDDVLKEHLQHSTSLLIDEAGDPLDSSPPRQTADCWLGDSLDTANQIKRVLIKVWFRRQNKL